MHCSKCVSFWGTSYSRPPIDPYLTSPLLRNPGGATGCITVITVNSALQLQRTRCPLTMWLTSPSAHRHVAADAAETSVVSCDTAELFSGHAVQLPLPTDDLNVPAGHPATCTRRFISLVFIYLFAKMQRTIFAVKFTMQQAGKTSGCTALMCALNPD